MSAAERAIRAVALVVARHRRARFVEEWLTDLAAARENGAPSAGMVWAAVRVAGLLARWRIGDWIRRPRTAAEVAVIGAVGGMLLVTIDFPLGYLIPVVLLEAGVRVRMLLHRLRRSV